MQFLYNSGKKSSAACRAMLPDGEYIIGGGGREGKAEFPMYYVEKYPKLWAGVDTSKHLLTGSHYGYKMTELDFEKCEVGVYQARLLPQSISKGGTG